MHKARPQPYAPAKERRRPPAYSYNLIKHVMVQCVSRFGVLLIKQGNASLRGPWRCFATRQGSSTEYVNIGGSGRVALE